MRPICPKFDLHGLNPKTTPKWWPRRARPLRCGDFRHLCHQVRSRFQRARLFRRPSAQSALQRSGCIVFVSFWAVFLDDVAAHAQLTPQRLPMQHTRCLAIVSKLLPFFGLVIGKKPKTRLGNPFEKNHPRIGKTIGIHCGQRHGVWIVDFRLFRLDQPAFCDLKGIVTRKYTVSCHFTVFLPVRKDHLEQRERDGKFR